MLKTEMRNPKTTHIDRMSSEQIVRVIQDENKYAVQAIDTELAAISAAVSGDTAPWAARVSSPTPKIRLLIRLA